MEGWTRISELNQRFSLELRVFFLFAHFRSRRNLPDRQKMGSIRRMEPGVTRYAIREAHLENGERIPLLVHGDPLGLPVPEIVEFAIAKLRACGLRRRSIYHRAEAFGRLLFERCMSAAIDKRSCGGALKFPSAL